MLEISPETEKRIIELWFRGFPRDTIARRTAVSGSTVSKVINELPECLRALRKLSVELRKIGISPSEALKGTKLHSKLADLDVEPDQLQDFLKVVRKLSRKAEYPPKQVVQATMKLSDLEDASGKTYPEAMTEFEATTEQTQKLEEKNAKLQEEVDKKEEERKQKLSENRTTSKEIEYIKELRQTFRRHGIRLTDAENLLEYLRNMRETGGNPKKFIQFTRKHGSLKGRSTYLENQKEQKKLELNRKEEEIEAAGNELSRIQIAISELEKKRREIILRLVGLDEREIQLKDKLQGLAACVAQMLGTKTDVVEMNEAISAKVKKLQDLEDDISRNQETIGKKQSEIGELDEEIQKLEKKKQSIEHEAEKVLEVKSYATEHKTAIAGLEQKKGALEKECAEKSAEIALGETITNFLTRMPNSDFNKFASTVEWVKSIREERRSNLEFMLPRTEERIRMTALRAFKGDLIHKEWHEAVVRKKEEYRKENIALKEELGSAKGELTTVTKERDSLRNVRVYVEGRQRTLEELRDWTISVHEEEIERRANEKFDKQAARTKGVIDWIEEKRTKRA